ncbi:MAG: hypothetical protein R2758_06935 [Bacteroidales bacterium]
MFTRRTECARWLSWVESNENDVIVEQGLKPGEKLYLSIPEDGDRFKLQGEDLIAIIKERKKQKAEEEAKRQQNGNNRPRMMPGNMTPEQMREMMQNLTPEQREAMRQQRGAGRQGRDGQAGSSRLRYHSQGTDGQNTQPIAGI